jgi:valyl-tRNA synthetase
VQPTGKESLVEQWILHKLNLAAAEINTQLAERNFMSATSAAYQFWLYELCDVYIEAMKPMTEEGASAATKISSQQTLYTCLDHGLRLLHPFMPFVTEELWQRLPRRPNDSTPSIMIAQYPVQVSCRYHPNLTRWTDREHRTLRPYSRAQIVTSIPSSRLFALADPLLPHTVCRPTFNVSITSNAFSPPLTMSLNCLQCSSACNRTRKLNSSSRRCQLLSP